ncbi:MAG: YggT family protein [Actinomycetota bacterium]|nr:MAG: YggT family protein [Actinomycetota bacterium]
MEEPLQEVRETTTRAGNTTQTTQEVYEPGRRRGKGQIVAARIIWWLAGVLLAILALRFIFTLLGANPANAFANFIYSVSYPFVSPFFNLFGYSFHYGVSHLEIFTLVAMVIYALIAWGLARLVTITRD